MKLVWFGGTTARVHLGGKIFVIDLSVAPREADRTELASGANHVLELASPNLPRLDPATRERRARTALDAEGSATVRFGDVGEGAVLIDEPGEASVLLLAGDAPAFGRWADGAVVILFSSVSDPLGTAQTLLQAARPKLLALAMPEQQADEVFAAITPQLEGAGLMILQPGLALEA